MKYKEKTHESIFGDVAGKLDCGLDLPDTAGTACFSQAV
jgi:hypothetical protein